MRTHQVAHGEERGLLLPVHGGLAAALLLPGVGLLPLLLLLPLALLLLLLLLPGDQVLVHRARPPWPLHTRPDDAVGLPRGVQAAAACSKP